MRKILVGLSVFQIFGLLCGTVYAESSAQYPSAGTSSTLSRAWERIRRDISGSHTIWLIGPNTQALSGNKDGSGTNLTIIHYPSIGYRLGSKWKVSVTQPFNQVIDENPKSSQFGFTEPYINFSNSRILHSDIYGAHLSGAIRYYFPVAKSSYSAVNTGSPRDAGHGSVRIALMPSKSFLDGSLKLAFTGLFLYRFNKNSPAQRLAKGGPDYREDFYFLVTPNLAYEINSDLEVYAEYATGYIRHTTNGKFSKLNDPDYGQWISVGTNHQIGKRLSLNPYLSVGPVFRGIKNTDIGLLGTYAFL